MLDGGTILIAARAGPLGCPFLLSEYTIRNPRYLLQGGMSVITPESAQYINCGRTIESGSEQIIVIERSCFIYEYAEYFKILTSISSWSVSESRNDLFSLDAPIV